MKSTHLQHELGVLRARVEAGVGRPAVVTVTSARRGDGKSLLARGLADSLAAAGHSTLFIDAATDDLSPRGFRSAPKLIVHPNYDIREYVVSGRSAEPDVVGVFSSGVGESSSLDSVESMLAQCRASYQFSIIDTSVAIDSPLGLLFASASDALLIAIQRGRAASGGDRELLTAIKGMRTTLLGVVPVAPRALLRFTIENEARQQILLQPKKRAEDAKQSPPLVTTR